ncbi:Xanthine permease XanP [Aerococcus viridans]|nr:Xanthine permease XanP [Aerococcus viridans]
MNNPLKDVKVERNRSKYDLDGVPPLKEAIPLGLQHVFAMFLSNIAVPIILAKIVGLSDEDLTVLVQSSMVMAGIATLIQTYPIWIFGAKLPIVMGSSFGFLPTNIAIVSNYGISGLLGATFIGGLFGSLFGLFVKPLRRFFPKVVTGTVVLTIGISLLPTGITAMAGGSGAEDFGSAKNWMVSLFVMTLVLLLNQFGRGMIKTSSILIAIIIGYFLALFLGMVEFTTISNASWFSIPKPFYFPLEFKLGAIAPMIVMFVVTSVETIGDVTAITMGGADREPTDRELSGAVLANGMTSSLAAMFNSLANTSFSQNVGIITFTKMMSRFIVAVGSVFLIGAGLIPKLGALLSTLPQSVIGGASIIIFSQITLTGIDILTSEGLTARTKLITGLSLSFGLGLTQVPEAMTALPNFLATLFGGSSIVIACLVALTLNIVLPEEKNQSV